MSYSILRKFYLPLIIFLFSCGKKDFPVYPPELTEGFFQESIPFYREGKLYLYLQVLFSKRVKEIRIEEENGKTIKVLDYPLKSPFVEVGIVEKKRILNLVPVLKNGLKGEKKTIYICEEVFIPRFLHLKIQGSGNGNFVTLRWEAHVIPEGSFFNIYRIDKSPYYPLNFIPLEENYFVDSEVEEGKTYRYYLRPVTYIQNYLFEGPASEEVNVLNKSLPPSPPVSAFHLRENGVIKIFWTPSQSKDISGYNLYLLCDGKKEKLNSEPVEGNSFILKNYHGRRCSFGISAVGRDGQESTLRMSEGR